MNMKIKLLDYALVCALTGVAPMALAQEAPSPQADMQPDSTNVDAADKTAADATGDAVQDATPAVDCRGDTCTSDQGVLMRIRTRGERQPVTQGTTTQSSSQALQPCPQ